MSKVTEDKWTEIPGGDRHTLSYGDGTSRDIDITKSDGERHVTVTDHSTNGESRSGDGASGFGRGGYDRLPNR